MAADKTAKPAGRAADSDAEVKTPKMVLKKFPVIIQGVNHGEIELEVPEDEA